jgi:hypothetical protein
MKFIYTLIFSFFYISIFSQTIDSCKISIGEDLTVCTNSKLGIAYNSPLKKPIITWSGTVNSTCNNCPQYVPNTKNIGNFLIYITAKSGVCSVSDTLKLEVLPAIAPTAVFLEAATICSNQKISIGNSGNDANFTYAWSSLPVGYTSNANNPNVSPSKSTTYFVSVLNATCPFPLLDTVKITAFDFTNIGLPKDTTVCKGKPVILCKDAIQTGATYTWSPATYCSNVNNLNATFTPAANLDYQLEVKAGLCKVSYTVVVKTTELNIELALGDTAKVCQDAALSLLVGKTLGIGSLSWYENGIKQSKFDNLGSTQFFPNKDTKYTVQFQNGGCIVKDSTYAKVFDNLKNMTFPVDSIICKGTLLQFAPQSGGKSIKGISSIAWSVSPILPFLNYKDTFYCKPDASLLVKVVVKTGICEGTVSKFISVKEKGDLKLKVSKNIICKGEEIEIQAASSFPLPVTWIPSINCTDKNCTKAKITPAKDLKYIAFTQGNCAAKDSITIQVKEDFKVLNLGGDTSICKGTPKTKLFLNETLNNPDVTYTWTTVPKITFTSKKDTLFYKSDTSFVAYLKVSNGACEKTISQIVNVKKTAILNVIASKSVICEGEITELTVDGKTDSKLEWTPSTVKCIDGNCTKINVSPTKDQVYTFKSGSNSECETTGSILIKVNPLPSIEQPGKTTFCIGDKLDTLTLNTAPDANTLYTWQSQDDLLFQTTNAASPKIKPYKSAIYTVKMKKGDCEANASVTVKVVESGFIKLMKDTLVCLGEPVTLSFVTSLTSTQIQKINWISGGSIVENKINPVLQKNVYSFEMDYTINNILCNFKDSVKVLLKPAPAGKIDIDPNFNFLINEFPKGKIFKFSFNNSNNLKVQNFSWLYNDIKDASADGQATIKAIIQPTVVKLKVTAENGCMTTFETPEFIPSPISLIFPKVFTPDSDQNKNFTFYEKIGEENLIDIENLSIFNRWGERVFYYEYSVSNPKPEWNGKKDNEGEELPTDVYIYHYQARDKGEVLLENMGEIMLLR